MTITVIYGPSASGKTVNADRLQQHYGCQRVIDDWWVHRGKSVRKVDPRDGDLVLTSEDVPEILKHFPRANIVSIASALASVGGAA
jgi:adenylate kinase family enzyme